MIGKGLTHAASRRDVMRGAAGFGLAAPLAMAGPASALAQSKASQDYSGHPVVGVWIEGGGPTFTYHVYHADGIYMYYNPWIAYLANQGDPKLPTYGIGVWQPTGDRTVEGTFRIAWGDTSVTSLMTFQGRGTVDETGEQLTGDYRMSMVDATGKVIITDSGSGDVFYRMQVEPFETPATPAATPGA